jgi:hypothetical protein
MCQGLYRTVKSGNFESMMLKASLYDGCNILFVIDNKDTSGQEEQGNNVLRRYLTLNMADKKNAACSYLQKYRRLSLRPCLSS